MRRFVESLLLWAVLLLGAAPAMAGGFNASYRVIPVYGGVSTTGVVLTPRDQGSGPFPLIVMPTSWGAPNLEYVGRGAILASQGYVVVSYTSRGFWEAGGLIDIAGPETIEDVSAVIDWALANTPSDPKAVGASGISYGAGISLLAAERDPRIKAVAALSGWADLEASLYANQTVSQQGAALLVLASTFTGRPGPLLAEATAHIALGDFDGAVAGLLPHAPVRSAITDVASLNTNKTAVLLANAYGDSLFPPLQYINFFNHLNGPKQLLFAHGDHGTVEIPGVLGLPNEAYDAAGRWFDRHLKGLDNGVDSELPVRLKTQDGQWNGYADWAAVQAGATTFGLGKPGGLLPTGSLSAGTSSGWQHRINTGVPTLATSGIVFASGFLQGLTVAQPVSVPLISHFDAAVWSGPAYATRKRVTGAPKLHITVTPSQANTSLFAYLYSVDVFGTGELLTHRPYSLRNAVPGVARTLDIELEATSWEIPAGRKLVLVVDTIDPRYASASQLGGNVVFSSPASSPSTLTVPLR